MYVYMYKYIAIVFNNVLNIDTVFICTCKKAVYQIDKNLVEKPMDLLDYKKCNIKLDNV